MLAIARNVGLPQQVADQMVFTDIAREEVNTRAAGGGSGREVLVMAWVGILVQVGFPEHVALSYDARRNADCVDGAVEFGVCGGKEHGVEAAAGCTPYSFPQRFRRLRFACCLGAWSDVDN